MVSLKKNIIANFVGQAWGNLLSFLFVPFYLKFMGIEAYGLIGFFLVLQGVLSFLDLGIGSTLTRELARLSTIDGTAKKQRDLVRTLECLYWGMALIGGGAILLLAPYIAHSWVKAQELSTDTVFSAIRLMGILVAIQFPYSFYRGGLMGLQRQVFANGILMVVGTFRSVGGVLVLWQISPTIEAFLTWQIIVGVLGSVALFIALWHSLPKSSECSQFNPEILRGVWKYAVAISATAIIGVILGQLDKIILIKMLPLKAFGYYALAGAVASIIWSVIAPFNTAVFPHFVQLYSIGTDSELQAFFHRSSQFLSLLLLPVSAILIVFSREILTLWTHNPIVANNSHLIASLLVTGIMLNGLSSLSANAATAFGWPQLLMRTNAAQAIVIIPLIVGMVYWLQGIGAAIAWVVLNSMYTIFLVPRFFGRYMRGEQKKWYLSDVAFPSLAAFSVSFISFMLLPKTLSPIAMWSWLAITGMLSIWITGFVMSSVRSWAYSWWKIVSVKYRGYA